MGVNDFVYTYRSERRSKVVMVLSSQFNCLGRRWNKLLGYDYCFRHQSFQSKFNARPINI